jgi:hypothetical protein
MTVHESSVNFENLIRDLAEMYPFDVSEVVVIELIANSLDARATLIGIDFDSNQNRLVVQDNGSGMNADQFADYHDFAAGLKVRGTGIGFAGLGAKVSFNIADRVITETRSSSFEGGSDWYLRSKKKLIWEEIEPTGLHGHGTRVEVQFRSSFRPMYQSAVDLIDRDLADAAVQDVSADRRFAIAYEAALQLATITLYASGYETHGTGHHFNTFEPSGKPWARQDKAMRTTSTCVGASAPLLPTTEPVRSPIRRWNRSWKRWRPSERKCSPG